METINSAQRSELRAKAHLLHPVVMISEKGLSATVLSEIERALESHELIKIRVFGADRTQRDKILEEICSKSGAHTVQHIGRILIIYRKARQRKKTSTGTARASKRRKPPSKSLGRDSHSTAVEGVNRRPRQKQGTSRR